MSDTFYEVLSVSPDASEADIEAAYRAAVKETHPDVSDDPDAADRFQRVTRARDILTDPEERARYDRLGHEGYVAREFDASSSPGTYPSRGRTGPGGGGEGGPAGRDTATDRGRRTGPTDGRSTVDDTAGEGGSDPSADPAGPETDRGTGRRRAQTGSRGRSPGDRTESGGTATMGTNRTAAAADGRSTTASVSPEQVPVALLAAVARLLDSLTLRELGVVAVTFICYPVFLSASVFPAFPLAVNVAVAVCTLAMVAYLMSVPEVAVVVFGLWTLLTPVLLVALDAVSVFSLVGVAALVAAWFPLVLAVLTRAALHA